MKLSCSGLGKRYQENIWIIRNFTGEWAGPAVVGISGDNGSGKSTLLRMLCGYLSPTEGNISYNSSDNQPLVREEVYCHVQIAAPYDGLVDFMTIEELFKFHYGLRELKEDWTAERWRDSLDYTRFEGKKINELSSGMRQRLRLLFACTTRCDLLFLDEPSSYLDVEGKEWWKTLLADTLSRSTTLCMIASNEPEDLSHCTEMIQMSA